MIPDGRLIATSPVEVALETTLPEINNFRRSKRREGMAS
jgi:hypothetical protein